MHLLTRPSKSFLFDYLESLLSDKKGNIGIDAASDRLRNRHMFRTKFYFGIDKNREALIRGLKSTPDPRTFGLEGDLRNLSEIPKGSADVVLSSNTLYQIPTSGRKDAVSELIRITSPDGICFLEFNKDIDFPPIFSIIRKNFSDVKTFYFKNSLSFFYEKLAYDRYLNERPIFSTLPLRIFSWALSRLEYLTKNISSLNKHVVVIAQSKKSKERNTFDVKKFKKIDNRLYSLFKQ